MNINEIYKNGFLLNKRNYYDITNFNEAKNIIENETENKNLILIIEDQSLESTISIIGSLISKKSILLIDLSFANWRHSNTFSAKAFPFACKVSKMSAPVK